MTALTVFYDGRCGLCCAVAEWVNRQPKLVPVRCALNDEGRDELVVAADTGERWEGDDAWVMVLWTLAAYRAWAYRLAHPLARPTARAVFASLSAYRGSISCALGLPAGEEAHGQP